MKKTPLADEICAVYFFGNVLRGISRALPAILNTFTRNRFLDEFRARICTRLRSPPACVAWWAGTMESGVVPMKKCSALNGKVGVIPMEKCPASNGKVV